MPMGPVHPYVVHFAVGLVLSGVVLFFVGTIFRGCGWAAPLVEVARWNLWIGAAFALASIGTGFLDYIAARCDQDAIAATIIHRRSGAVTWWSALIAGIAAWRTRHQAPGPLLLAWLALVAVATLTAARLGTQLTYGRGLGVAGAWPESAAQCYSSERGP